MRVCMYVCYRERARYSQISLCVGKKAVQTDRCESIKSLCVFRLCAEVCVCVCVQDQVKQSCLERKHAADGCGCPAVTSSNGLMSITDFIQLTISSSLCLPLSDQLVGTQPHNYFANRENSTKITTIKTTSPVLCPSLHLQLMPNVNCCFFLSVEV